MVERKERKRGVVGGIKEWSRGGGECFFGDIGVRDCEWGRLWDGGNGVDVVGYWRVFGGKGVEGGGREERGYVGERV